MSVAIFLDREGTITRNAPNGDKPLGNGLIHGAASAIASLRGLRYKIVVVTNEPATADGHYAEQDIVAGHTHLNNVIRRTRGATVARFYYCPYEPGGKVKRYRENHPWRKPNPGMLMAAKENLQIDLSKSWAVGSGPIDVKADVAAGARTILLNDKLFKHPVPHPVNSANGFGADFIAPNLIEPVKVITQQRISESNNALPTPSHNHKRKACQTSIRHRQRHTLIPTNHTLIKHLTIRVPVKSAQLLLLKTPCNFRHPCTQNQPRVTAIPIPAFRRPPVR